MILLSRIMLNSAGMCEKVVISISKSALWMENLWSLKEVI